MSNCNNYEKIKRSIEEENKKYKYCYIQGPTGPQCEKGDPGPSIVQIGKVETIEPNEKAEIVNIGTPVDVVLDFKIPRGEQGIEGKIGPQGIPGPQG